MKNFRKVISATLTVVVLLTCLFVMASCKHEHAYTEAVTAPTCTEKGYTTYTCECGESYVDNYVDPAHDLVNHEATTDSCTGAYATCKNCGYTTYVGHNYVGKVTRLPSTRTTGVKTYTCSGCGKSYTETINAVSMTMPSVAEALHAMIGANSFGVEVAEDSQLVLVKELSDYTNEKGYKNFFSVKVAEASVSGAGEALAAYLGLKIGVAEFELNEITSADDITDPTFTTFAECYVYVNGEDVSVEIANAGGEMNEANAKLSTAFYNAVAGMLGITYEDLVELTYVGGLMQNYLPLAEGVVNAIASIKLPEANTGVMELLALLGESVVEKTVVGTNTRYSFNFTELAALLEGCGDKTIADIIDAQYGEGTAASIIEFVESLPDKKIKDIANSAITFSENCGVPIEDIYALINYVVFTSTNTEFDIEAQIKTRYEKTIAELIVELSGETEGNVSEIAAQIKANITEIVEVYTAFTIDQIGNLVINGNPYFTDEEGNPATPVTDALNMITSFVSESVFANVELDAEGKLVSLSFALVNGATPMAQLTVTVDGANVNASLNINNGSGEYITASLVNNAAALSLTVKQGNDTLLSFYAPYGNDGVVGYAKLIVSTYVEVAFDEETGETTYQLVEMVNVTYTASTGNYLLSGTITGYEFAFTVTTDENVTTVGISFGGMNMITATLTETAAGLEISATINGDDTYTVEGVIGQSSSFTVKCGTYEVMSAHLNKDDNGVIVDASFEVNIMLTEEDEETGDLIVKDLVNSLLVTYEKVNGDGDEELYVYFDDLGGFVYELTLKSHEGFVSLDVYSTMGEDEDKEVMLDAFVSAELTENGVTLTFDIPKYMMVVNNIVSAPVGGENLGAGDLINGSNSPMNPDENHGNVPGDEGGKKPTDDVIYIPVVGGDKDENGGIIYVPGDYEDYVPETFVETKNYFSLVGAITFTFA